MAKINTVYVDLAVPISHMPSLPQCTRPDEKNEYRMIGGVVGLCAAC